ncbi:replication initiator protein [Chifec microvirus UA13_19]|nr:replication initiator protein [Chifec microvirus UA13_19]
MPCYHPLPGWYGKTRGPSGKRPVVFQFSEGLKDRPVSVPCGRCTGCLLERARTWAARCQHESQLHESNLFVTLTYDDSHLPPGGSLDPRHMVLFLKRLRKAHGSFRFFQCGEYGEDLSRPHHHALLFGVRFDDARQLHGGSDLRESAELERLWGHGLCTIGDVTFESAGYVARYSMKKLAAAARPELYPPYLTMSRRPGIGSGFIERHARKVVLQDFIVSNGHKSGVPRFYRDRLSKTHPVESTEAGYRRKGLASVNPDSTGCRLIIREVVKQSSIQLLKRDL